MAVPTNKGEMALALGKIHDFISKAEKGLDTLKIESDHIDQAIQVLKAACEDKINSLKDIKP